MTRLSDQRQNKQKQQGTSGLDSAALSSLNTPTSVTVYDTLDSLPMTGLSIGTKALVGQKLYFTEGNGWYNVDVIQSAFAPYWDTEPNASYSIVDSATPLLVIAKALDSDNPNLINQSFGTDSAQYMVDITRDSSVFTFTPKTKTEIGTAVAAGNLTDSNGDFIYTFKWSDGFNFVTKAVTIEYNPVDGGGVWYGDRHVYHIGFDDGSSLVASDTLEYFSITSAGTVQNFGNLSALKHSLAACGDASRGIFAGGKVVPSGNNWGSAVNIKVIDYITIATAGNSSDFGDLDEIKRNHMMTSDGIRGISAGGVNSNGSLSNAIEYITIQTTGDGSDFGDLLGNYYNGSAFNDATRSVIIDGAGNATIEYVTTQTLGDATDFGDHTNNQNHSGSSDATRGLIIGGNNQNTISYVTIQTTGDATDFGDLTVARMQSGSASDGTYSTTVGGTNSSTASYDVIDRVTIQTTGHATDYADMTVAGYEINSVSGNAA